MNTSPSDASRPGVLVVIPTLNEARGIEAVIARVLEDPPPGVNLRLVVADGGSRDGTVERVQRLAAAEPRLQLLHNPRRIQSAALNLAVQRFGADAEVLVRCDAHAGYPRGFVRQLLASLAASEADAVVVPMDSRGEGCFQRAVAWVSNTWAGTGGSAHRGGRRSGFVDHGHHAAFRMSSYRRAGGYDESFTHNEDAELDCRQRACGARIWLDADIRLDYLPRDSARGLWRQYFAYGRGRARTAQKHPHSLRARQLAVPAFMASSALALALAPLWPLLLLWPGLYLAALAGVSLRVAAQQRSWCGLASGPAAGLMHLAWALGFGIGLARSRERRWHPSQLAPLALERHS